MRSRRDTDVIPKGTMLGKYKVGPTLGQGGFSRVYRATDTVEGRDVALKIPHDHVLKRGLTDVLREVRISVKLSHPNVLPLLNATFEEERLLIAYALGEQTLSARLQSRLATKTALDIARQLVAAVAYLHSERIVHCDINPDNVILFDHGVAKLTDFGIAKIVKSTRIANGSGSGTVGYMAPEQAMGLPSFRSDVFSLGLLIYRMLSGCLPRWPFDWPWDGAERVLKKTSPEFVAFLRTATAIDERKRFKDALVMAKAFEKLVE